MFTGKGRVFRAGFWSGVCEEAVAPTINGDLGGCLQKISEI